MSHEGFHWVRESADPSDLPITERIWVIRGKRVLIDSDLAALYGVPTKRFNEQVRRNVQRFPPDFMFELLADEVPLPVTSHRDILRSQIATSKPGAEKRGGRRYLPRAFTEHGAIMAASILNSERAVRISVHVVRAFVRLRELAASNDEVAARIAELETRLSRKVDSHDQAIVGLLKMLSELKTVR